MLSHCLIYSSAFCVLKKVIEGALHCTNKTIRANLYSSNFGKMLILTELFCTDTNIQPTASEAFVTLTVTVSYSSGIL